MLRYLIILFLASSFSFAQSNPSFGSYQNDGATGTLSITSTAGATIVVDAQNIRNGSAGLTIDGTAVQIFRSSVSWPNSWDAGAAVTNMWVKQNVSAGVHTVVISYPAGTNFPIMQAFSVTGPSTVNPVEFVASTVSGSGTTCTGTATSTHTNDLILSFVAATGGVTVTTGSSTQTMTVVTGSGNVQAGYGVAATSGAKTAVWNISGATQYVCDTVAIKPALATPPTVSSVAMSPSSPALFTNQTLQMSAIATYSDGGLQEVSQFATWASSSPSVATINTTGIVLPATAGTTNGTATFNSVTSPNDFITINAYTPVTWYVHQLGGTGFSAALPTGQCDGLADVDYPGSGTNQHCAFNDVRFLWQDGVNLVNNWKLKGQDTAIIRGSVTNGVSYRIGPGQLGNNCSGGLCWGLTNIGNSGMPNPPDGITGHKTHILGGNFGSCHSDGDRTQLSGGDSIGSVISLFGSAHVDVQCIDITDHAQCGLYPPQPSCGGVNAQLTDFADTGIHFHNTSTDVSLVDVNMHGLRSAGIGGSTGDGVTMDHVTIRGNSSAGWNADDGDGLTGMGSVSMTNYDISWNGCVEEFPIVHATPFIFCVDQNYGGYGDGFGTSTVNIIPNGTVGTPYVGYQVPVLGTPPDTYTITGGSLPPGLSLSGTGFISGTPGTLGIYPVTIRVDDSTHTVTFTYQFQLAVGSFPSGWQVSFDQGTVSFNTQDGLDALHIAGNGSTLNVSRTLAFASEGEQIKVGGATATMRNNIIFGNCDALGTSTINPVNGDTIAVASNVVTITTPNRFHAGETCELSSLVTEPLLNGQAVTVTSATGSQFTFTSPVSLANLATHAEQGLATYPIAGRPIATGDALGLLCRAGNVAVFATTSPGFTTVIQDNTIYGSGNIGLELDFADSGATGSTNVTKYQGNVFIGFLSDSTNIYAAPGSFTNPLFGSALGTMTNPGGAYDHNSFLNTRAGFNCATGGGSSVLCTTPGLVNQTMPNAGTVNVTPSSGASAVVGAGIAIAGIPIDYAGITRPNPPSIGALEFAGGPTVVSLTVLPNPAAVLIGGTVNMATSSFCVMSDTTHVPVGIIPCTSIVWSDTGAHSSINPSTGLVTGVSSGSDTVTGTPPTGSAGTALVNITAPPPTKTVLRNGKFRNERTH